MMMTMGGQYCDYNNGCYYRKENGIICSLYLKIVLILICLIIIQCYGNDDIDFSNVENPSETITYGTEITWPMQRNRNDNIGPDGVTATKMGVIDLYKSQHNAYRNYMKGCSKRYNEYICKQNDNERITINYNQPQYQRNYTHAGYAKINTPIDIHNILIEYYNSHEKYEEIEVWDNGNIYTNHWIAPSKTRLLEKGMTLLTRRKIIESIQIILEKWSNTNLQPTSLYGIRSYTRGSILAPHVDRVPLVISAIINVAQDVDEPWPLEVIGHDGVAMNITMEPGEMILYESHSIIHGRPYPLNGNYYANIFVHFEPIGYTKQLEKKMKKELLISSKELFNNALQKENTITTEQRAQRIKKNKLVLPNYIQEGSLEASRWRQEFVFHREDPNIASTTTKPTKEATTTTGTKSSTLSKGEFVPFNNKDSVDNNKKDNDGKKDNHDNKKEDKKNDDAGSEKKNKHVDLPDIHRLAQTNDVEGLKYLIDHVSNVKEILNESDPNGWKPIHEAARAGHKEVIQFLLEHDVDVNDRTNNGDGATALWWAEHALPPGHDVIDLLRQNGAIAIGPNH